MLHVGKGRGAFHKDRKSQGTGGTPPPSYVPALKFNDARNSMYL